MALIAAPTVTAWLDTVRVTPVGSSLPHTLYMSGSMPLPATVTTPGYVYCLRVGNATAKFTASYGKTAQDVVNGLVTALGQQSILATAAKLTVTFDWATASGVLSGLKSRIDADGVLSVTAGDDTNKKLTLTAGSNGTFTVNGIYASSRTALDSDPAMPTIQAGADANQVSKVIFATPAAGGYLLTDGTTFSISLIDNANTVRNYSATIGKDNVTGDWTSILGKLKSEMNAAGLSLLLGTDLTIGVDTTATAPTLTLTALTKNISFTVLEASVITTGIRVVDGGLIKDGTTPSIAVGTSRAEVRMVEFSGDVTDGMNYTVAVNGGLYSVNVGDTVHSKTVVATWASVLEALTYQINNDTNGVVTATYDADVTPKLLKLTAKVNNTAFTLGASSRNEKITTHSISGNYVLIMPDRSASDNGYSMTTTATGTESGSLTVVNFPTHSGETINLGAAGSLVVVSNIAVGNGDVTLSAAKGLTLGGTVTAGNLSVSAGDNLTMKSAVSSMTIALSSATTATDKSDLILLQEATSSPDLTIMSLTLDGGDINIVAHGDIIINSITGSIGSVHLVSETGRVEIKEMTGVTSAGAVTIEAALDVVLGSFNKTIDAATLDIIAGGAITVYDTSGITINQLESTSDAAVTVHAGGNLLLNSAIIAASNNAVSLVTTAGSISLNEAIVADSGSVMLDAAAGLTLSDMGDISSKGGNITLYAGIGTLTMTGETVVDSGAGWLSLDADGSITLGKLRSSKDADLVIHSGGVVDAADGSTDIVAKNATLVITSTGGIGTTADAIEIQVKALDLTNSGSGDIALEEVDALIINHISQTADGAVTIRTKSGSIDVTGTGISATKGDVLLYAGGGAVTLAAAVSSNSASFAYQAAVATSSGAVSITAEQGNILLKSGIRVDGAGNIILSAASGSILTDSSASAWLKNTDGITCDSDVAWAMSQGKFSVSIDTGAIIAQNLTMMDIAQHPPLTNDGATATMRAAGGAYVQTTDGTLTLLASGEIGQKVTGFAYSPLAIFADATTVIASSSNRSNVSVITTDAVEIGVTADASGSRGGATNIISLSGTQTINSAIDASGADITISGEDININAQIRSAGATLTLKPLDPTQTIVVGGTATFAGDLNISSTDIGNIGDGFGAIVIGTSGGSNPIELTGTGVTLNAPTTVYSDGEGGSVLINADVTAPSFVIYGSGETTTLAADITSTTGYAKIDDSVRIKNDVNITATGGTVGYIKFGQLGVDFSIVGDSASTSDTLTLTASSSITFYNSISNYISSSEPGATDYLSGLTIISATDVTFYDAVTIDGDLSINATGSVIFQNGVHLLNGGSLSITGASSIYFANTSSITLDNGGNLLLEGDEIDLSMGTNKVVGTGTVTLRTATKSREIQVANPEDVFSSSALHLDMSELNTLAEGFSQIIIGHKADDSGHASTGSGIITLGSLNSSTPLFRDDVSFYGGSIIVSDNQDSSVLRVGFNTSPKKLTLDALNDITIYNEIEVDSIELYSAAGSIAQVDSTTDGKIDEALRSLDLKVTATTGVTLDSIETPLLSVANTTSGDVTLTVNGIRTGATGRFSNTQITGDVGIVNLSQAGSGALSLTAKSGTVTVLSGTVSNASALTLNGVTTTSAVNAGIGTLSLDAQGSGEDLLINKALTSHGAMSLTAADAITTAAGIDLQATASGSNITLTATAGIISQGGNIISGGSGASGGLVTLVAGSVITMTDGKSITSVGTSGRASLQAVNDILLSKIVVTSSLSVTSSAGKIIDNLTGDGANLTGESADATVYAATGIGAAGAALQTALGTLVATDVTSGGVFIVEATDLKINNILPPAEAPLGMILGGIVANSGLVSLILTTGNLSVTGGISSTATNTGCGNILLQTFAGNIDIEADVTSSSGNISAIATGTLNIGTTVFSIQLTTLAEGMTVDVQADGSVTMGANSGLVTNNGAMRVQAGGSMVLGQLDTGVAGSSDGRMVSLVAGEAITDADAASSMVNVTANSLRMESGSGVGTPANAIEMSVDNVAAKATASGGSLYLSEYNGLAVGSIAAVSVNRVSAAGTTSATADTTVLAGLNAGTDGNIVLRNGTGLAGSLTVNSDIMAAGTGNMLVQAANGVLTLNADVNAGSGNISIIASGALVMAAIADVVTSGSASVDISAASLSMTDGSTVSTSSGTGNIRVVATTTLQLGGISTIGDVSLSASTITDAWVSGTDTTNISADELCIVTTGTASGNGVGLGTNHLEISVNKLAGDITGTGVIPFLNQ